MPLNKVNFAQGANLSSECLQNIQTNFDRYLSSHQHDGVNSPFIDASEVHLEGQDAGNPLNRTLYDHVRDYAIHGFGNRYAVTSPYSDTLSESDYVEIDIIEDCKQWTFNGTYWETIVQLAKPIESDYTVQIQPVYSNHYVDFFTKLNPDTNFANLEGVVPLNNTLLNLHIIPTNLTSSSFGVRLYAIGKGTRHQLVSYDESLFANKNKIYFAERLTLPITGNSELNTFKIPYAGGFNYLPKKGKCSFPVDIFLAVNAIVTPNSTKLIVGDSVKPLPFNIADNNTYAFRDISEDIAGFQAPTDAANFGFITEEDAKSLEILNLSSFSQAQLANIVISGDNIEYKTRTFHYIDQQGNTVDTIPDEILPGMMYYVIIVDTVHHLNGDPDSTSTIMKPLSEILIISSDKNIIEYQASIGTLTPRTVDSYGNIAETNVFLSGDYQVLDNEYILLNNVTYNGRQADDLYYQPPKNTEVSIASQDFSDAHSDNASRIFYDNHNLLTDIFPGLTPETSVALYYKGFNSVDSQALYPDMKVDLRNTSTYNKTVYFSNKEYLIDSKFIPIRIRPKSIVVNAKSVLTTEYNAIFVRPKTIILRPEDVFYPLTGAQNTFNFPQGVAIGLNKTLAFKALNLDNFSDNFNSYHFYAYLKCPTNDGKYVTGYAEFFNNNLLDYINDADAESIDYQTIQGNAESRIFTGEFSTYVPVSGKLVSELIDNLRNYYIETDKEPSEAIIPGITKVFINKSDIQPLNYLNRFYTGSDLSAKFLAHSSTTPLDSHIGIVKNVEKTNSETWRVNLYSPVHQNSEATYLQKIFDGLDFIPQDVVNINGEPVFLSKTPTEPLLYKRITAEVVSTNKIILDKNDIINTNRYQDNLFSFDVYSEDDSKVVTNTKYIANNNDVEFTHYLYVGSELPFNTIDCILDDPINASLGATVTYQFLDQESEWIDLTLLNNTTTQNLDFYGLGDFSEFPNSVAIFERPNIATINERYSSQPYTTSRWTKSSLPDFKSTSKYWVRIKVDVPTHNSLPSSDTRKGYFPVIRSVSVYSTSPANIRINNWSCTATQDVNQKYIVTLTKVSNASTDISYLRKGDFVSWRQIIDSVTHYFQGTLISAAKDGSNNITLIINSPKWAGEESTVSMVTSCRNPLSYIRNIRVPIDKDIHVNISRRTNQQNPIPPLGTSGFYDSIAYGALKQQFFLISEDHETPLTLNEDFDNIRNCYDEYDDNETPDKGDIRTFYFKGDFVLTEVCPRIISDTVQYGIISDHSIGIHDKLWINLLQYNSSNLNYYVAKLSTNDQYYLVIRSGGTLPVEEDLNDFNVGAFSNKFAYLWDDNYPILSRDGIVEDISEDSPGGTYSLTDIEFSQRVSKFYKGDALSFGARNLIGIVFDTDDIYTSYNPDRPSFTNVNGIDDISNTFELVLPISVTSFGDNVFVNNGLTNTGDTFVYSDARTILTKEATLDSFPELPYEIDLLTLVESDSLYAKINTVKNTEDGLEIILGDNPPNTDEILLVSEGYYSNISSTLTIEDDDINRIKSRITQLRTENKGLGDATNNGDFKYEKLVQSHKAYDFGRAWAGLKDKQARVAVKFNPTLDDNVSYNIKNFSFLPGYDGNSINGINSIGNGIYCFVTPIRNIKHYNPALDGNYFGVNIKLSDSFASLSNLTYAHTHGAVDTYNVESIVDSIGKVPSDSLYYLLSDNPISGYLPYAGNIVTRTVNGVTYTRAEANATLLDISTGRRYIRVANKWRDLLTNTEPVYELVSKFNPSNHDESLVWHLAKIDNEYFIYVGNYSIIDPSTIPFSVGTILQSFDAWPMTTSITYDNPYFIVEASFDSQKKPQDTTYTHQIWKKVKEGDNTTVIPWGPTNNAVFGGSYLNYATSILPVKTGQTVSVVCLNLGDDGTKEYIKAKSISLGTVAEAWYNPVNINRIAKIHYTAGVVDSIVFNDTIPQYMDICRVINSKDIYIFYGVSPNGRWTKYDLSIFENINDKNNTLNKYAYISTPNGVYKQEEYYIGNTRYLYWKKYNSSTHIANKFVAISNSEEQGSKIIYENPYITGDFDTLFKGKSIYIRTQPITNNYNTKNSNYVMPDYDDTLYETFLGKVSEVITKTRKQSITEQITGEKSKETENDSTQKDFSISGSTIITDIYLRFEDEAGSLNKDLVDLLFKTPVPIYEDDLSSYAESQMINWSRVNALAINKSTYPATIVQNFNLNDYVHTDTLSNTVFFPARATDWGTTTRFTDSYGASYNDADSKPLFAPTLHREGNWASQTKIGDRITYKPKEVSHHAYKKLVLRQPKDDLYVLLDYMSDPHRDYMTGQEHTPLIFSGTNSLLFNRDISTYTPVTDGNNNTLGISQPGEIINLVTDKYLEKFGPYSYKTYKTKFSRLANLANSGNANLLTVVSKNGNNDDLVELSEAASYIEADGLDTYISMAFLTSFATNSINTINKEKGVNTTVPSYGVKLDGQYEILTGSDEAEPKIEFSKFVTSLSLKNWSIGYRVIVAESDGSSCTLPVMVKYKEDVFDHMKYYDPNSTATIDVRDYIIFYDGVRYNLITPDYTYNNEDIACLTSTLGKVYYKYTLDGWTRLSTFDDSTTIRRKITVNDNNTIESEYLKNLYPGIAILSENAFNYNTIYEDTTGDMILGYVKRIRYAYSEDDVIDQSRIIVEQVDNIHSLAYPPEIFGVGDTFIIRDRVFTDTIVDPIELFLGDTPGEWIDDKYTSILSSIIGNPLQLVDTPNAVEGFSEADYYNLIPAGTKFLNSPVILTGPWIGHENEISCWTGSEWLFDAPEIGRILAITSRDTYVRWDGVQWSDIEVPAWWWDASAPEGVIAIATTGCMSKKSGDYIDRINNFEQMWKYITPEVGDILIAKDKQKYEFKQGSPLDWHNINNRTYQIELDNGRTLDAGTYRTAFVYPPLMTKVPEDNTRHSFYTADIDGKVIYTNNLLFDYENRVMIKSYNDRYFGRTSVSIHKQLHKNINGQFYNRLEDEIHINTEITDFKNPISANAIGTIIAFVSSTGNDKGNYYYNLYTPNNQNLVSAQKVSRFEMIGDGNAYFICVDEKNQIFVLFDTKTQTLVNGRPNILPLSELNLSGGEGDLYAYFLSTANLYKFKTKTTDSTNINIPAATIFDFPPQVQKWVGSFKRNNFYLTSKGTKGYTYLTDLNNLTQFDALHARDEKADSKEIKNTLTNTFWSWNIDSSPTSELYKIGSSYKQINTPDYDCNSPIFNNTYSSYPTLYEPCAILQDDFFLLPHYKYDTDNKSVVLSLVINNQSIKENTSVKSGNLPNLTSKYGKNNSTQNIIRTVLPYHTVKAVIDVPESEMTVWGDDGMTHPIPGIHLPLVSNVGDKYFVRVVNYIVPPVVHIRQMYDKYREDYLGLDNASYIVDPDIASIYPSDPLVLYAGYIVTWNSASGNFDVVIPSPYQEAIIQNTFGKYTADTSYYYDSTYSTWLTDRPIQVKSSSKPFRLYEYQLVEGEDVGASLAAQWVLWTTTVINEGYPYVTIYEETPNIAKYWAYYENKEVFTDKNLDNNPITAPFEIDNLLVQGVNALHRMKVSSNEIQSVQICLNKEAVRDLNIIDNNEIASEVLNIFEVLDEGLRNTSAYNTIVTDISPENDIDGLEQDYNDVFGNYKKMIDTLLCNNPILTFDTTDQTFSEGSLSVNNSAGTLTYNANKTLEGMVEVIKQITITDINDLPIPIPELSGLYLIKKISTVTQNHIELDDVVESIDDIIYIPQEARELREYIYLLSTGSPGTGSPGSVSTPGYLVKWIYNPNIADSGEYIQYAPSVGDTISFDGKYYQCESVTISEAIWTLITDVTQNYDNIFFKYYEESSPDNYWTSDEVPALYPGLPIKDLSTGNIYVYGESRFNNDKKLRNIDGNKSYNSYSMLKMALPTVHENIKYLNTLQKALNIDLSPFISISAVTKKSELEHKFGAEYFENVFPPREDGKTNELISISTNIETKINSGAKRLVGTKDFGYYVKISYNSGTTLGSDSSTTYIEKWQLGPTCPPVITSDSNIVTALGTTDISSLLIPSELVAPNIYWEITNRSNVTSTVTPEKLDLWADGLGTSEFIAAKIPRAIFNYTNYESGLIALALTGQVLGDVNTGVWIYLGEVSVSMYTNVEDNVAPLILDQIHFLEEKVTLFSAFDYNKALQKYDIVTDTDWLNQDGVNRQKYHSLIGSGNRISFAHDWETYNLNSQGNPLPGSINTTVLFNGLTSSAAHEGVDVDTYRTLVSEKLTSNASVSSYGYITSLIRGQKGVFYGFQPNAVFDNTVDAGQFISRGWYYFCVPSLFDYIKLPDDFFVEYSQSNNLTSVTGNISEKEIWMESYSGTGKWERVPMQVIGKKETILVPDQFYTRTNTHDLNSNTSDFVKERVYTQYLPIFASTMKRHGPPFTHDYPREFGYINSNSAFYQLNNMPIPNDLRSWRDAGPAWSTNVLDWTVRPIGGYWFRVLTNIGRTYDETATLELGKTTRDNDSFVLGSKSQYTEEDGTLADPVKRLDIINLLHNCPPMFLNIVRNECWIEDATISNGKLNLLLAGKIEGKVHMEVYTIDVNQ